MPQDRVDSAGRELGERLGQVALVIVGWLVKHLLLLITLALASYAALPVLAPVLMHSGHERLAEAIYLLFRPLCHQLPERSFFLYGAQKTYTVAELAARLGESVPTRYIGNATIGYKIAVCQRDVAIYTSMLLAMIMFGPWARRLRPWPLWLFAVCAAPMLIDGGGQLVGLWQSSPWSRVITGVLFGVSIVRLALPLLARGLVQARSTVEER